MQWVCHKKRNCIHFIHCTYLIRKWLQPFRWSLCNVSIYTGDALQWYMDHLCVSTEVRLQACGGHSSTFPVVCRSLPSISAVSQLSLPIFCLPFVLWLYHSSLFFPLFLVLMRSLITASVSLSLSSSSSSLHPIFHFWWTPISPPSLPLSSPSLMLISVVRLPLFVRDF